MHLLLGWSRIGNQETMTQKDLTDPIFAEEQDHLSKTYDKLKELGQGFADNLKKVQQEAAQTKQSMSEEFAMNLFDDSDAMESYADLSAMNKIIESYNISQDSNTENLKKVGILLEQPYFAKVSLQFKPGQAPKDLYIGKVGIADENYKRLIVDWRSPVAETYYNQDNGKTSYVANGKTISVDLSLRRQFDLSRNVLNAYFDTSVALQDSLLIASLSKQRTSQMQAITATIQKEQNEVVRHEEVPVLLVNGIAGSGKTSVLLQRIAYLFYQRRQNLKPEEVYLITPNPVFERYIDGVLPELGERNPEIRTWNSFVAQLLPSGRLNERKSAPLELLWRIDEAIKACSFEARDYKDIMLGSEKLFSSAQIKKIADKFSNIPASSHLVTLIREELLKRMESRLKQKSKTETVHNELSTLSIDEQLRLFRETIAPQTEEDLANLSLIYLQDKYQSVVDAIEQDEWLRIDRIGMRILGVENLESTAWLYLKMALTGLSDPYVQYVIIDEVQDYTADQLAVLARYFRRANFMLLGDKNQAIKPNTASFDEIKEAFTALRGSVEECHLMTSYRSSPEITALFASLLSRDEQLRISSIRREETTPLFLPCQNEEEALCALIDAIKQANTRQELTAVILPWKSQAKRLEEKLKEQLGDNAPVAITSTSTLPNEGVVLITLGLAKGLEFDHVIIPDASQNQFPPDEIAKNRLYTTISRATKRITIISSGALSPLFKREN